MNQPLLHEGYTTVMARPRRTSAVNEIIELVNDPRTSVARLASVISRDPSLTKRLLRQANSPLYGFQRRVSDPGFAVVLLGFDALKEMVVRSVVNGAFRRMVDTLVLFESFWTHSIGCALGARLIALKTGTCEANDAFVAGLLHDVGYLIINESTRAPFSDRNRSPLVAETTDEYGLPVKVGHPDVGAALGERWHLPADIIEAIRCHHTPSAATRNPALTATVHVAEALCHKLNLSSGDFESCNLVEPSAIATLGVHASYFEIDPNSGYVALFREELARAPKFETLVQELRNNLVEAMGELEEPQRLVVALLYYEGLSVEDCSKVLGIPVETVDLLHNAAFARLRAAVTVTAE